MRPSTAAFIAICLLASQATAAHISVGDYRWDVTATSSIDIQVNVSGGQQIDSIALAFAVGNGGPDVVGSETILIHAINDGLGTIWSGKTMNTVPTYDLPSGGANLMNTNLVTSTHESVAADGTLMTITLAAPVGGLTDRIGQELTLDPNLMDLSGLGLEGATVIATFAIGRVTLTPEPSTTVLLLSLSSVLLSWRCFCSRRLPKP